MNRIRHIDAANATITVESGVILQEIQTAAAAADRFFPLSLGAEGSCHIGGNLSTNAGGINVLRYGTARDLVLGLEVVLPDGRIWDGLRSLRKDNTGYDLKQLFLGAEGTLGIITAAVLRLFPRPRVRETAFVGLPSVAASVDLLNLCRDALGEMISAFELIPRIGLDVALRHIPGTIDPLAEPHEWYALFDVATAGADPTLRDRVEAALADAFEAGLISDATVAASELQRNRLWFIREALVDGQRKGGLAAKHDVSVPVSHIAEFVTQALETCASIVPGSRTVAFGHVGDGNIHYNVMRPVDMTDDTFRPHLPGITRAVHDAVIGFGGSISAEHGIGLAKRDEMAARKSSVEIDLMRCVKAALDPDGIMNPGKVVIS